MSTHRLEGDGSCSCGFNDATTSRGDGWPMCDRHAAFYDGLVRSAWEEMSGE